LKQGKDAVRWAKEAGIDVRAFFIIGFRMIPFRLLKKQ